MNVNEIIGRHSRLFAGDLHAHEDAVRDRIAGRRVLVYGGAGSIGRHVVRQCFALQPAALHVVDISENNLVELVRDLRSSLGYSSGETQFLPIAMNSPEAVAFLAEQAGYDIVFNLAAMKHVRSEKDAFSLMRMIGTNVLDVRDTLRRAADGGASKYFAVSTDKAKNPANLMGATKRIMEDFLFAGDVDIPVTTARSRTLLSRTAACCTVYAAAGATPADLRAQRYAPVFRHRPGVRDAVPRRCNARE